MRKSLLWAVAAFFVLSACQKEEVAETPGNIPGMGNTPGNLEVKAVYNLPEGIEIVGEVSGLDDETVSAAPAQGELKSVSASATSGSYCYGSGGRYIRLAITLENKSGKNKTVFFPKGLVWKCKNQDYQHAINVQSTWVCINQYSRRTFFLDLYCINHDRHGSNAQSSYVIVGISGSPTIAQLLNLIGWRKINFEMINGNLVGTLKSAGETEMTYKEITDRIQNIIWNLTDKGIAISAEDEAFIASIPEVEEGLRPTLDADGNLVEYFDEYVVEIE